MVWGSLSKQNPEEKKNTEVDKDEDVPEVSHEELEDFVNKSEAPLADEEDEHDKETPEELEKAPGCCKRSIKVVKKTFLTSISLFLLNMFYVALGGLLFHMLEKNSGKSNYLEFNKQINATIDMFEDDYNAFQEAYKVHNTTRQSELVEHSCELLSEYQVNITNAYLNDGWRYNKASGGLLWSYSASVLFCVTVITTIGYGNMVPSSTTTRVICILYALIGIPLMLMFIHHLGDHLGQGFEWFFYHATCMGERRPRRSRKEKRLRKERKKREQKFKPEKRKRNYIKKICIPLHVSICVIGSYLSLGGLLFSKYGVGEWDFENAIYFSFVTLSTIGFGDLVFNQESEDGNDLSVNVKATIAGLYIIFGLALMSMCFDHMTFTFREQFHVLGDMVNMIKEKCLRRNKSASFVDVQAEEPAEIKTESKEKDEGKDKQEEEPVKKQSI